MGVDDTQNDCDEIKNLQLMSIIGFNGNVNGSLHIHPDRNHMVYPLGSTVIIQTLDRKCPKQAFLNGHSNNVSCITISKSGRFIASGQVTHMGFKAAIIVWDYETQSVYCKLELHKVKVEALAFSPNEKYLVSLGGQDDGSVVVWDLKAKKSVCGSPAAVQSAGTTFTVKYAQCSDDIFVTGGDGTLRVWELDLPNRKIRPTDCTMGQLKRIVKCIEVDCDDKFFYCGTTSGDILKVNMKTKLLCTFGPQKDKFSQGIIDMKLLKNGNILVGCGNGTLALVKGPGDKYQKLQTCKVDGSVTSITLRGEGHQIYIGTTKSEMHSITFEKDFCPQLITTSHYSKVNDVAFPPNLSRLFGTCSKNDIRIWDAENSRELLRIRNDNLTCTAIDFMKDGRLIISAWDDGKIRAYLPMSGKLLFQINNAHNLGVTAIATTSDCKTIVSGGGEGQVRVWSISPSTQTLKSAMKEHKSSITCIKIKSDDKECVTASTDGTCIIWCLTRFVRKKMVMANTLFQCVNYDYQECQIVTSGTDRKLAYWDVEESYEIRNIDASISGSINGMDIAPDGRCLVTGGDDKLVKVWDYNAGETTHVGKGLGGITKLKMSPDYRMIVTVNDDGSILMWRLED